MKEIGKGIGHGKTILFGEHFVVYGLPAIASTLNSYTETTIENIDNGLEFVDNRPASETYKKTKKNEIQKQINSLIEHFKIDLTKTPLKITLAGNLKCASGIGASAALATSVSEAISNKFELNLTTDEIYEATCVAEEAGSGTGNGIDSVCSAYKGIVIKNFEKKDEIKKIKLNKPVEIVLANSGITQMTKPVVADVKKLKEQNPEKFEKTFKEYSELFNNALHALNENDWETVGKLMTKNHKLLQKITVSCVELDEMQKIALNAGAFGSKLTGTGRGGLLISLTPGKELQEKVANALKEKNFEVIKTKIGI